MTYHIEAVDIPGEFHELDWLIELEVGTGSHRNVNR